MTGIERLRELTEARPSLLTCDQIEELRDISAQIAREHAEDCFRMGERAADVSMSAHDLLPQEDRDAISWVKEHGGLESVKERLDWVVGHCSTNQQLDFDFWLSGRVMYALGFDEDMADRDEVERRLLARLMPEGGWPRYEDGEMVLVGSDFADGLGEAHTVTSIEFFEDCVELHWNLDEPGEFEYFCHGERVKRPAPKVLDADGVEIRVGETVYSVASGEKYTVTELIDGTVSFKTDGGGYGTAVIPSEQLTHRAPVIAADGRPLREGETVYHTKSWMDKEPRVIERLEPLGDFTRVWFGNGNYERPENLTHERPEIDSWERLEEDATKNPFDYCKDAGIDVPDPREGMFISDVIEPFARDLVRRAKALAGDA